MLVVKVQHSLVPMTPYLLLHPTFSFKQRVVGRASNKVLLLFSTLLIWLSLACSMNASSTPTVVPNIDTPQIQEVWVEPVLGWRKFDDPVEMIAWPDARGGGFAVADRSGIVTLYANQDAPRTLLDLRDSTQFIGNTGLLSVALDPRFDSFPFIYVWYYVDNEYALRLSRFRVVDGLVIRDSELVILSVPQSTERHNGGAVRFGPDGMLYLSIGSDGPSPDRDFRVVAQEIDNFYGSVIRIDVRDSSEQRPYSVPMDNPLLGVNNALPEIYAWGFRNPWRMEFDYSSGELWLGDVGHERHEEVNIVKRGGNYGWGLFEGSYCEREWEVCANLDHTSPVVAYSHDSLGGCAVIGGGVYRGSELPWLQGSYIFGDHCSGRIWSVRRDGPYGLQITKLMQVDPYMFITSFAKDEDGELYMLVQDGPILKIVAKDDLNVAERRATSLGDALVHGDFDIYLVNGELVYIKESCDPSDADAPFFLHVFPQDESDLPVYSTRDGFDNLNFDLHSEGWTYLHRCFASITIPEYPIGKIRTGQFTSDGQIWNVELNIDE